ncbi:MAG: CHAT domain-containing tetratricopeptide repeat protein [Pseudomonadota bacterium]
MVGHGSVAAARTPGALIALVVALLLTSLASAQGNGDARGVVVTDVGPSSETEAATIRVGDRLLAWRVEGSQVWTPLQSPFDLAFQQTVCRVGCIVEIRGERESSPMQWQLRAGDWRVTTRPFTTRTASIDETLNNDQLQRLADDARQSGDAGAVAWALAKLITRFSSNDDWEATNRQLAALDEVGDVSYRLAALIDSIGALGRSVPHERMQVLIDAAETLVSDERVAGPARLRAQLQLAEYGARRGQLDLAEFHLTAAEKTIARDGLDSPFVAEVRTLRGAINVIIGDLPGADRALTEALAVLDRVPGRTDYARFWALRSLGISATIQGRLDEAEAYSTEALRLVERTRDRGAEARLLNNLGILFVKRGDMARAEYYYQRAMALNKSLGSFLSYAYNLANLGDLAIARQDNERAAALFQTARETILEQSPDSADAAQVTTMLAHAQFELGQFAEAERNYRWSLALYERVAPGSLYTADVRIGLGDVALKTGDQQDALNHFSAALAARGSQIPGSVEHAEAHVYLGLALKALERFDEARARFEAAEEILATLSPDSMEYANTLFQLGQVAQLQNDTAAALKFYETSVAAAERQTELLGGADDSRAAFSAKYAELFEGYVDLLLAIDRPADAFAVFERYRARLLLAMLAERESTIRFALPDELAAERQQLEQAYADSRAELMIMTEEGADDATLAKARQDIVQAEVARNALTQRLRAVAEGFVRLRYPRSLSLVEAQRALDDGTLALSYRVTDRGTTLFIVARDRFDVIALQDTNETLRNLVSRFRLLIDLGRNGGDANAALQEVGTALHNRLVSPVGDLSGYERLLVVADGPLHGLPFAALVAGRSEAGDRPRYLVESIPVHKTLSLTLYDELRQSRTSLDGNFRVAAFANASGSDGVADPVSYVSAVLATARTLEPLPWSADEVRQIANVYGGDMSFAEDDSASEPLFVDRAADADIVHIAAHAIVDEQSPLDSALVFELNDGGAAAEDGLLQAWEIFDRLRLRASLVVLSACRTGFGRETSSEGLLGLQRAFLYAGARSVVSSLWNVADRSTRDLMVEFHVRLEAGADVDNALRDAQLALLQGEQRSAGKERGLIDRLLGDDDVTSDFSHPYHWAGFELAGDYRALR